MRGPEAAEPARLRASRADLLCRDRHRAGCARKVQRAGEARRGLRAAQHGTSGQAWQARTAPPSRERLSVRTVESRANRLFLVLTGFFLTNALIGEFIGVKIFALEATLGAPPFNWSLFGISGTLNFTAGVIVWPFVFILTDVINEYFGVRGVRFISWVAVGLISYAYLVAYATISLAPAK